VAKSKPAKAVKSLPALEATPKKSAAKAPPKPAAKKPTTPKAAAYGTNDSALSHISICHAAGDVWGMLSNGGPKTIAEIKKSVKVPAEVVVAAVGWLAREDKLEFDTSGKTVKIGLK
jgi:Winged helix-turn-helix domain (DUF2582)